MPRRNLKLTNQNRISNISSRTLPKAETKTAWAAKEGPINSAKPNSRTPKPAGAKEKKPVIQEIKFDVAMWIMDGVVSLGIIWKSETIAAL